jgi:hypothetical protein
MELLEVQSSSPAASMRRPRQRMSRRSGIRFAGKDMRQQDNLRRFPVIVDYRVIQYDREAL